MKFAIAIPLTTLAYAIAQDTYSCPDGWLAEMEDGPDDNYFIVSKLIEKHNKKRQGEGLTGLAGPHFEDQWWIGAKSYTKHDEHRPGEWIWEHLNTSITWFDWAPNEPNDYHRQQCL